MERSGEVVWGEEWRGGERRGENAPSPTMTNFLRICFRAKYASTMCYEQNRRDGKGEGKGEVHAGVDTERHVSSGLEQHQHSHPQTQLHFGARMKALRCNALAHSVSSTSTPTSNEIG